MQCKSAEGDARGSESPKICEKSKFYDPRYDGWLVGIGYLYLYRSMLRQKDVEAAKEESASGPVRALLLDFRAVLGATLYISATVHAYDAERWKTYDGRSTELRQNEQLHSGMRGGQGGQVGSLGSGAVALGNVLKFGAIIFLCHLDDAAWFGNIIFLPRAEGTFIDLTATRLSTFEVLFSVRRPVLPPPYVACGGPYCRRRTARSR